MKNKNKTIECIKNIKQLYIETNELKQIAKEQQNNIQNLNLISNENTQHIEILKEQTNENLKK